MLPRPSSRNKCKGISRLRADFVRLLQFARMTTPRIIPRAQHAISRKYIDPDALKVLARLRQFDHVAYLVGGSVRDLLLGRRPKDFDVGTSAHPYEVKRLFRNCWIIGRRFRLAHIKFGQKTIEVATFRRQVTQAELEAVADGPETPVADEHGDPELGGTGAERHTPVPPRGQSAKADRDHLIHRDNTFGTPEEDAFRRDFTVNALFYDIATFSVIDYVGGIDDLQARVIRCIGDPDVRFLEDPVRMLRAIVLAARLDFTVDPPIVDAIRRHAPEIAQSAPPRLLEEFYKILRSGSSERAFRELAEVGLLRWIAPELQDIAGSALWSSLAALDRYRHRFESAPDSLTNAMLLGTLLVARGFTGRRPWRAERNDARITSSQADDDQRDRRRRERDEWRDPNATLGSLPLARRDVERLRQILGLQRRLTDMQTSPRAKRALMHRGPFPEALTWLEIHGQAPEIVEHWRGFLEAAGPIDAAPGEPLDRAPRRRRRRRGRRRRYSDRLS
jgi:poly(A) polymerase